MEQATEGAPRVRVRVRVEGVVQGVGFRPFVHGLAHRLGLSGFVGNDDAGVFVEAEGSPLAVDAFLSELAEHPPPLASVHRVTAEPLELTGDDAFLIVASRSGVGHEALVAPDAATCDDCLREIRDPADRRYGYAFTNCTNCGPRYTIVRAVPYDRGNTTMAAFVMCDACRREYDDPTDRRFHAQPVCCPDCGPHLRLLDAHGRDVDGDPIAATASLLASGAVVAVKGLGGYHLAATAADETAVRRLRSRKHREERPFALMVRDLESASLLCDVGADDVALLTSPAAPIVVLPRRPDAGVADAVAPAHPTLGLMLPYTPLHHLLLDAHPEPVVLTSGNVSDEPIAYDDADALRRLAGIADAFLVHDRPIETRVDDSVVRSMSAGPLPVRRSRGFAPRALPVPWRFPRHVLGCGAELKSTCCVARDDRAFVSQHVGDLENYETLESFITAAGHLQRLFDVQPKVVVHDLHPDYLSTKWALDLDGVETLGVQHHHAHIASCLVDNGFAGPVIGVAFDGLGYGTDGTLWGGEWLLADLAHFTRVAHLRPVPLPGGAQAIRQPWRLAAAYVDQAYDGDPPHGLAVERRNADRWGAVQALARSGLGSPATTSVGRLFDAVAAILGVRDEIAYEGQAAILLEALAEPCEADWPVAVEDTGDALVVDGRDLLRRVVDDLCARVPVPVVAGRFHDALARATAEVCSRVRDVHRIGTVALSGGVFQNALLVTRCVGHLETAGFTVLTHRHVPPNDGGISLGQVAVAGAVDRGRGLAQPRSDSGT